MVNTQKKVITVSAAIIINQNKELLLVRKHGTVFYMQVGGKFEPYESAEDALIREIQEEIQVDAQIKHSLGIIHTTAANEVGFELQAHVFEVDITGHPCHSAEIAEISWIDFNNSQQLRLAPLTEQFVLPYLKDKYS